MKIRDVVNEAPAVPANAAATAGKAAGVLGKAGKFLGKALPGVGLAAGAYDVYARQQAGDTTGAALSGAATAAGQIPVIGTAASLGLAGVQAIRDKMRTGSWMPDEDEIKAASAGQTAQQPAQAQAQVPPGGDPKVFALQQKLIAKGAKIKADGKMGPATQTAMKQFPDVQMASKEFKGNIMTEAERIAALRDRLSSIENTQVNEGPLDALKAGWGAAKNFAGGVAKGVANPAATNLKNVAAGTTASTKGIKTGAALARNPGKVAAGAAAAGAAGMAALSGGAATKPADPVKPPAPGPKPPAPGPAPAPAPAADAAAAPAGLSAEEQAELDALDAEMQGAMGGNPEIDAALLQYKKLMGGA